MEYLYETIRDRIKHRILEGSYQAGSRLPGSRELSVEFETTPVTVDRAFALLVEEGLVKRIPKSGTYVTKPEERAEPTPVFDSGLVGVIAFDTSVSVYWSAVVKAMEDALLAEGFHMVIGHSDGSPERALRYVDDLAAKGIRGFLFAPITIPDWTETDYEIKNAEVVDRLSTTGLPFALYDRLLATRRTSGVSVDNYKAAKELALRLLDAGIREPLCFSSAYSLTTGEREQGFIAACIEKGVPNPASRVIRIEAPRVTSEQYPILLNGFRARVPDGIFSINSSIGNGLADVLDTIPEASRLPLVSFEDFEMRRRERFAHLAKCSVYDMGFAAGELLSRLIREKGSFIFQHTAIDIRLSAKFESLQKNK